MRTFTLSATLALLLAGCASTAGLNIQNPSYAFRAVHPRIGLLPPAIDFDIDLEVNNPNSVGLRLDGVDFNLLVDGTHLVSGRTNQSINIPRRGIGTVHLTTRVGANEIRSIWQQVLGAVQGNRARYQVEGTAFYDTPVGRLQFPLTVYTQ